MNKCWSIINISIFRILPRRLRVKVLRLFGAHVHPTANVYPTVICYEPKNLRLLAHSCVGPRVRILNTALVEIGERTVIGSDCQIITTSRAYWDQSFQRIDEPVEIGADVWIAIGVTICKGLRIGNGSRILIRAIVTKDVADSEIVRPGVVV